MPKRTRMTRQKLKILKQLLPALLRDAERDLGLRAGEHELLYYDKSKKRKG